MIVSDAFILCTSTSTMRVTNEYAFDMKVNELKSNYKFKYRTRSKVTFYINTFGYEHRGKESLVKNFIIK